MTSVLAVLFLCVAYVFVYSLLYMAKRSKSIAKDIFLFWMEERKQEEKKAALKIEKNRIKKQEAVFTVPMDCGECDLLNLCVHNMLEYGTDTSRGGAGCVELLRKHIELSKNNINN